MEIAGGRQWWHKLYGHIRSRFTMSTWAAINLGADDYAVHTPNVHVQKINREKKVKTAG